MPKRKPKIQTPEPEAMPGTLCNCGRCGAECKVAPMRNEDAQMLRHSKTASGMCVNCAVTEWLVNTYPANMIIEESRHGAAILLFPALQEQFAELFLKDGYSDATRAEIDWQKVVDNWSLPLKVKHSPTNPHLPGDSVKRKLAEKEIPAHSIGGMLDRHLKETVPGYRTHEERVGWLPDDSRDMPVFNDESGNVN